MLAALMHLKDDKLVLLRSPNKIDNIDIKSL